MATLLEEDELPIDDEEQQRRKQAAQDTIGSMPRPNPSSTAVPADMPAPDVGATPAPPDASTIAGVAPYNRPAAPRPQSQAFTDWQASDLAQHPTNGPRYHGLARVGDTIANMTWPGQAAEVGGEFGTKGAEAKAARLAGNAELENKQIGYGETERENEAKIAEQAAKAETERRGSEVQQVPLPGGGTAGVMTKNIGTPTAAIINSAERGQATKDTVAGRETVAGINALSRELIAEGKPVNIDQLAARAIQKGDQATISQIEDYKKKIAAEGKGEPGNYAAVNDAAGNITGWVDPKSRHFVSTSEIPGVGESAGGPGGTIPAKPSSIEKRMADLAGYSVSLIDDATTMIQNAKNELGPAAGRWNDFVAGKIGAKDVTWTGINAQLDYVKGAITLAHSQGRVSNIIYDTFNKLYDAGKQDPDNLLESLRIGRKAMGNITAQFGGAGAVAATPAERRTNPKAPGAPAAGGPKRFADFIKGQ